MLKHIKLTRHIKAKHAAAFGRLCVETVKVVGTPSLFTAAAFGRLCVETAIAAYSKQEDGAAAFGRLCVETIAKLGGRAMSGCSRLRAAVC